MKIKKNIFVMGLDEFNLKFLNRLPKAHYYTFHGLLNKKEIVDGPDFDIANLLKKVRKKLNDFNESIDAIVSYWDFPSVLLVPLLRQEYGLKGPSIESILKCEHKYWSRLEQARVIPDNIPRFSLFHPADDDLSKKINLPFPFWIKPVTAHSSLFGYKVRNASDLKDYCKQIRKGIRKFSRPLDDILKLTGGPDEILNASGECFIAEEIISKGKQCTLEGYVLDGKVHIYGIVDSIRGPNRSSFVRYEYPSCLPIAVQDKMKALASRVVNQIGLEQSPFNMEFFYDPKSQRITVLEINARISKSHSPLFEKVEGIAHTQVMIDVALGHHPKPMQKKGAFRHAAKFMPRVYGECRDLYVAYAPDPRAIQTIEDQFLNAAIEVHVQKGLPVIHSCEKDSYSYELATIFMGANSHKKLMLDYQKCLKALNIQLERRYENKDLSASALSYQSG